MYPDLRVRSRNARIAARIGGSIYHAFLIPFVVAIAAALVAVGLIAPFAGVGKALQHFDHTFLGNTETALRLPSIPERSTIYAADGSVLATVFEDENRVYVALDQMDSFIKDAVVAVEDHSFYEHGPVDVSSIMRAALANLRAGKVVQGGSTITQQLVKTTELGPAQTFQRKFQEAQDAIRLERTYTKDEILERYLNTVYFGHITYGIGAAAEYYFAKTPAHLSLPQAALLAGIIQAPVALDPIEHPADALVRRNSVLADMLKYGKIDQVQYDQAIAEPIKLSSKRRTANKNGPEAYWVRYVTGQFLSNPAFGKTLLDRRNALFKGGLKIYTTIQPRLQAAARVAMKNTLPNPGVRPPKDPESAVVSIVPQTGAIVAMVGGTDYSASQYDLASQGTRSAGSSFKAFTLAAALLQNVPPGRVYSTKSPLLIPECDNWKVFNAEGAGDSGYFPLTMATWDSINVVFAQLIRDIGPQSVVDAAHKMGITSPLNPYCSLTLGTSPVSPLEMTSAYSTLANQGMHCKPYAISKVASRSGKAIFKAKPDCKRAIPATIAAEETSILQGVVAHGTGTAANIGRPQAGKTGTGQKFDDAWFMGYVPRLSTGVWVGYSKAENIYMDDVHGLRGFGGVLAAPIWRDFMQVAVHFLKLPPSGFPSPPPSESGTVPDVVGMQQKDAEKTLTKANFVPIVKMVASVEPEGTVVSQSPAGGAKATLGTGVTIDVSNGKAPTAYVPDVVGQTLAQAKAAITGRGYVVAVQYQTVTDPKQDGIVLSQDPSGGLKRAQGTTVTIVVGKLEPSPSPSPSP